MAPPTPISYVDLRGKVVIVTGANAGLGLETARKLALAGGHVYLACRSEERAKKAVDKAGDVSPGRFSILKLDVSSQASVHAASKEFLSKESRLDILVNNAAVMGQDFAYTSDNLELTFSTNHVGPLSFTLDLLPLMKKTAAEPGSDVRIVTVASELGKFPKPKLEMFTSVENLNLAAGTSNSTWVALTTRYAYSKLYNNLMTLKLQQLLDAEGVDIFCGSVHPGVVATEGAAASLPGWPLKLLIYPIYLLISVTIEVGVHNALMLAADVAFTDPAIRKGAKGTYWQEPGKMQAKGTYGFGDNQEMADALWETSIKIIESHKA